MTRRLMTLHRLGEALSFDETGPSLGPVALGSLSSGGIAMALSAAYGPLGAANLARWAAGIERIRKAWAAGDRPKALVLALHLGLPEISPERLGLLAKFNPNHDELGRFTSGDGGASGTAHGDQHHVVIAHSDGSVEVRRGGSLTWRTHNPGAIEPGSFANRHGATGSDQNLAIFPSDEVGEAAQRSLITGSYSRVTLDQMVARWAPPDENNTPNYQALVRQWTGLPGSSIIGDLGGDQINAVMAAQRRMEGWKPGLVTRNTGSGDQK